MISLEDKALEKAKAARENSYSPYSNFRVGAAVISGDDRIFAGTNVENRSYGLTICAERAAIFSAVSKGVRSL
ncbi:MAG: cytidine deaminase, partial [candidate division Zixibacteria bacterium]|nr:cytidine deaminase [candidate division Zixibacteria bacterium]NIT52717.1 cytidine deaminase [candidate division Zixibacteria bacterium]NIX59281.1 cytidine deaminase [candidate division Zixibacteria bacterium]